jgi:hypothetical protein
MVVCVASYIVGFIVLYNLFFDSLDKIKIGEYSPDNDEYVKYKNYFIWGWWLLPIIIWGIMRIFKRSTDSKRFN